VQVNKTRERAQIQEWARRRQPGPGQLAYTQPAALPSPTQRSTSGSGNKEFGQTQPAAGTTSGLPGGTRKPNSAFNGVTRGGSTMVYVLNQT
jgi:hypothetical protein